MNEDGINSLGVLFVSIEILHGLTVTVQWYLHGTQSRIVGKEKTVDTVARADWWNFGLLEGNMYSAMVPKIRAVSILASSLALCFRFVRCVPRPRWDTH
jgi:hypothetical protein